MDKAPEENKQPLPKGNQESEEEEKANPPGENQNQDFVKRLLYSQSFREWAENPLGRSTLGTNIEKLPEEEAPKRATVFGFDIMKTNPLLEFEPKEKYFYLCKSSEQQIRSLEGECFILSLSGSPLVGKSSLLNLIISIMSHDLHKMQKEFTQTRIPYTNIYEVGKGKKSTTQGIDLYILKVGAKNLLILDVEGDNDPSRKELGVWIYTNLITSAVALSHIHMYNYEGLPQQNFREYFASIKKISKEKKFISDFENKVFFIKRDHPYQPEQEEEFKKDISEYLQEYYEGVYEEGNLFLLKTPPKHIINTKASSESCIRHEKYICSDCEKDPFMSKVHEIKEKIIEIMMTTNGYENGAAVVDTIHKILEVNKQELPFTVDNGHLAKIRMKKLQRQKDRIDKELLEAKIPGLDKKLTKCLQKIISEHPALDDDDFFKDFNSLSTRAINQLSQLDFLVPELGRFIEECLIDKNYTVLNKEEKEILIKTYVDNFSTNLSELVSSLKGYEYLVDFISGKLKEIKKDIEQNLQEYIQISFDVQAQTSAAVSSIVSSGVLGYIAKEAAVQMLAGIVFSGGALAGVLTAYSFYKVNKQMKTIREKNKKLLSEKKIEGINNRAEAEEALKKTQEFLGNIVNELDARRDALKDVCDQSKMVYFKLIKTIELVMDKKIDGKEVTKEDTKDLISMMKTVKEDADKFHKCI